MGVPYIMESAVIIIFLFFIEPFHKSKIFLFDTVWKNVMNGKNKILNYVHKNVKCKYANTFIIPMQLQTHTTHIHLLKIMTLCVQVI